MSWLRSFARFWWNFVVGDDWRVAVGIAASLGLTWVLIDRGFDPWWLLPPAVALVLTRSLWREVRGGAPRL